jgi:hypothetical protein
MMLHLPRKTFALAAVLMMAAGCATKAPTDVTHNEIAEAQAAGERATVHVDNAIKQNEQMQRDLNALRASRPAVSK